jgi:hypothetical protein
MGGAEFDAMIVRMALAICNAVRADHGLPPIADMAVVEDPEMFYRQARAAYAAQGTNATAIETMERRATAQHAHISDRWPYVMADQHHLQPDTAERAYWHYGYMTALRDAVRMMPRADAQAMHQSSQCLDDLDILP